MHTETELLKSIAEDIAAKQSPDHINEPKADHRLLLEANRLERAIIAALRAFDNHTQRNTFHNDTLVKLVGICDLLFDAHHRISPDVRVLLDLLTAIKRIVPREISPTLPLPKAFIFSQKELLKLEWKKYERTLRAQKVEAALIPIAAIPFERFFKGKEKLYWGDYTWLKGYIAKLDAVDWEYADCNSTTEALMSLLIGRDFNHDRFFIHCKKYITQRVPNSGTKKRRLQEYELCRKLIQEDTQDGLPSFDRHASKLAGRLLKLIREETEALKSNEYFEEEQFKVEYNWDVDSIALFYKYMMDKGITKKVTLELYARQIAATVSSVGKEEFQWETVYKRLYGKEQKTLRRLFEPLLAIVEDIRQFLRK